MSSNCRSIAHTRFWKCPLLTTTALPKVQAKDPESKIIFRRARKRDELIFLFFPPRLVQSHRPFCCVISFIFFLIVFIDLASPLRPFFYFLLLPLFLSRVFFFVCFFPSILFSPQHEDLAGQYFPSNGPDGLRALDCVKKKGQQSTFSIRETTYV